MISLLASPVPASENLSPKPGNERTQIMAAVNHMTEANEWFVKIHQPGYFAPW
jgi:hypothetical protein